MKQKNLLITGILITIFALFLVSDIVWLKNNSLTPHWDMGRHLYNSILYYNDLHGVSDGSRNVLKNFLYAITTPYRFYPPLMYINTAVWYTLLHSKAINIAILSLNVYVLILIVFTYLLSREFFSRKSSLMAVFFILTSPIVFTQLHEYMIDVPITAMYIMSLYFLVKSNHFKSIGYTLGFGIAFALSFLTKWTYSLVIIGPLLYELYFVAKRVPQFIDEIRKKDYHSIKKITLILICIILPILFIDFSWYVNNFNQLRQDLLFNAVSGKQNSLKPGIQWLLSYLFTLENIQTYAIYFVIFLTGLLLANWTRTSRKKFLFLSFSLLSSYIILTFINNKDPRYSIPLIIFIGLFAVNSFENIQSKKLYYILTTVFLVYGIFQIYFVSFMSSNKTYDIGINIPHINRVEAIANYGYTSGAPSKQNWEEQNIVSDIESYSNAQKSNQTYIALYNLNDSGSWTTSNNPYFNRSVYLIGDDNMHFNFWGLQYYITKSTNSIFLNGSAPINLYGGYYIIRFNDLQQTKDYIGKMPSDKKLLNTYKLPDGTIAYLVYLPIQYNLDAGKCIPINIQSGLTSYNCRIN